MTGVPRKYNETFKSFDPLEPHVVWSWFTARWPKSTPTNEFVVFGRDGKCFTATEFEIGGYKIECDPHPVRWDWKLKLTCKTHTSNYDVFFYDGVLIMGLLADTIYMTRYLNELDARHAMLAWCHVVRKRDGFEGGVNARVASFLF